MAKIYRIHPAIGICRVGNSDDYFIGPELPFIDTIGPAPGATPPAHRDGQGRVRPQAARFRIFEYDDTDLDDKGTEIVVGENGVTDVKWTVHLANKKATWYEFSGLAGEDGNYRGIRRRNGLNGSGNAWRRYLIDPGPRTIHGTNNRAEFDGLTFPTPVLPEPIQTLGSIRTEEDYRLIVVGGKGRAGHTENWDVINDSIHWANNDEWFDDVSDGPVRARIQVNGSWVPVKSAWVIVSIPDFAPEIGNIVSLYDVIYDLSIREFGIKPDIGNESPAYRPEFASEIAPILVRALLSEFVWGQAFHPWDDLSPFADTNGDRAMRTELFERLRKPGQQNKLRMDNGTKPLMPLIAGDNPDVFDSRRAAFLTMTKTQVFLMSQWEKGLFRNEPPNSDRNVTAAGLDKASLDGCSGGAFCPGMEVGWIIRNTDIYSSPFRIKDKNPRNARLSFRDDLTRGVEAGDLSKRMALPWQADYAACTEQRSGGRIVAWWPAQRPVSVLETPDSASQPWDRGVSDTWTMIEEWHSRLKFLVRGVDQDGRHVFHEESGGGPVA